MNTKTINTSNGNIVIVDADAPLISDGQSALDFIMSIGYEHSCHNIAIYKSAIAENFFKLSTGVAGEIAQKIVNYRYRLAIIGDFSDYSSKSLQDYIYECNKGGHLYFVSDENEAVKKLGE
jgi:hypothetical protein